jgi:hypothetical protein
MAANDDEVVVVVEADTNSNGTNNTSNNSKQSATELVKVLKTGTTPFYEIVVAPTSRASYKKGKEKISIEKGEIKLNAYYLPKKRNHVECTSKHLRFVTVKQAKELLIEVAGKDRLLVIYNLSPDQKAFARSMLELIANGDPVPESYVAKRFL